jgi:hypothetical protein
MPDADVIVATYITVRAQEESPAGKGLATASTI